MDDTDQTIGAPGSPIDAEPQGTASPSVGYANPPMTTRFKPGQTGNRRGRSRGSKNRKTIVKKIANETHTVTEIGKRRRRSNLELVLIALRNLAVEGNVPAIRAYQTYLTKFDPQQSGVRLGLALMPPPTTFEEQQALGEKANAEARARREAQMMKNSS